MRRTTGDDSGYGDAVRILWSSPLPPTRTGVADHAVELLSELQRRTKVRVATPPGWTSDTSWPFRPDDPQLVGHAAEPEGDEVNLVHLGNNPYHEWLLPRLTMPRTVVVLHDLVLHHLLTETTLARGLPREYRGLLIKAHGRAGAALADARRWGAWARRDSFLFPARKAFLRGVVGVVVHSAWARDEVAREVPGRPVGRIALAVRGPASVDRARQRMAIGAGDGDLVLMHLGYPSREKGLGTIITAAGAAARLGISLRLVFVGETGAGMERSLAERTGLDGRVQFTGWVPQDQLLRVPAAADLGVVLRTPSAGETSAAAARFLACGTPVAVNGQRQFLELPEIAAPRITPGLPAAAELVRVIARSAAEIGSTQGEARRRAARRAWDERHRPDRAARELLGFLASAL